MESKYVKCPKCKAILLVKNSAGERVKQFACPRCKASLQIRFDAHEEAARQPESDLSETVAAPPTTSTRGHAFVLTCNGATYHLQPGVNTVGRSSADAQASIGVKTSDLFMSRNHAVIRVASLAGGAMRATISNGKNKNATLVNGVPLLPGDEIFLSDGDQITMGQTILSFAIIH